MIHTQLDRIDDMCFIQNGNKQLSNCFEVYDEGIFAYNTDTDRLEWRVGVAKRPDMKENMDVGLESPRMGVVVYLHLIAIIIVSTCTL